jgi:hypothetical protein
MEQQVGKVANQMSRRCKKRQRLGSFFATLMPFSRHVAASANLNLPIPNSRVVADLRMNGRSMVEIGTTRMARPVPANPAWQ